MTNPASNEREFFTDPDKAVARAAEIYAANTAYLRELFAVYAKGGDTPRRPMIAYPYAAMTIEDRPYVDQRLAYGFIAGPGRYQITLTRPELFARYYREQFRLLLKNHNAPIEIGVSYTPIPIHFAFPDGVHVEGDLMPERIGRLAEHFHLPHLADMDDAIANGTFTPGPDGIMPLGMFPAPRVDYSLHRLRHYSGTSPGYFQNFVILTNYQFYVEEFVRLAQAIMEPTDDPAQRAYRSQYKYLVEPGDYITPNRNLGDAAPSGERLTRLPQMPAYHLVGENACGITIINIGVGPANAKTMTDHLAVLRPHAWIMLGHCAGLRDSQKLGDYVLAHAYVRDDHVLDADLPPWVPVPALAEVQRALESAVADVTGKSGYDMKSLMRTGTVVTTDNRNWELHGYRSLVERFSQSRAIALDMESSVVAGNGFRFRVPYGTLLCVSDKPLHGEIKLPGMANKFYRQQVDQHLQIGVRAMEILRDQGLESLHSRKLRSFVETAFQ
ncbi:MAG: AMP nucleosidase [Alphaproteobacteria bacterium]